MKFSSDEILAKVIVDKQSPFLKSIIVNKGSKHGVILGMGVLDQEYLVGKVVEVNFTTSRVLLLSDLNSKIPVDILPNNIQSILSGTGDNIGKIQYIKEEALIESDSIVYTSGAGGIFKPGVPIGRTINNSLNSEINVEFYSDFSQLRFESYSIYYCHGNTKNTKCALSFSIMLAKQLNFFRALIYREVTNFLFFLRKSDLSFFFIYINKKPPPPAPNSFPPSAPQFIA